MSNSDVISIKGASAYTIKGFEKLGRYRVCALLAADPVVTRNMYDVPMEYRDTVGSRVTSILIGLLAMLCGTAVMIMLSMAFVDPKAIAPAGISPGIGSAVLGCILICLAAGMAFLGFVQFKEGTVDRLVVTSDGLINHRAGGLTRVHSTTIPWSSITSFTVTDSGPRGYRHLVCAIRDQGKPVNLSGTARSRVAAAAAIADELTTMLQNHRAQHATY